MAKKPEVEKQTLSKDEMKAALAAEQQSRVEAASKEIQAVCEKHKVTIQPQAMLTNGNVQMSLSIVPVE